MTPPDYKDKAREWCPDELDHAYHGDKHACVSIATALTQADALGYARGRGEIDADADRWLKQCDEILTCDFEDAEPSRSGKIGRRCRLCGHYSNAPVRGSAAPCAAKAHAAKNARALTAEPAQEKP
jgi:hypothetical protein